MFLLKKVLGLLLSPVSLVVIVFALGVGLLWTARRQRLGKLVVTAGFAVLVVLTYGWLSAPALRALEHQYEPYDPAMASGVKWIVVLGGGTTTDPDVPLIARLSSGTLARLVEGIRLQRQIPGAKLVVSGSSVFSSGSDAEAMAALALALGVKREDMVLDAASPDTETQARNVKALLKGERCVLVTSASHMRRSMALFRKAGVDAIAAPTHYLAQRNRGIGPGDFYPSTVGLEEARILTFEYLGMAWGLLTGKI
jgi:uncharacterized SAM-binding protein YcdF (DUF218 family)